MISLIASLKSVSYYDEIDSGLPIIRFYNARDSVNILLTRCKSLYNKLKELDFDIHPLDTKNKSRDYLVKYLVLNGYKYNNKLNKLTENTASTQHHVADKTNTEEWPDYLYELTVFILYGVSMGVSIIE